MPAGRRLLVAAVVVCVVLAQLAGVGGLSAAIGGTGVLVKDPGDCADVVGPPAVPLRGIEYRRYAQSWSWAPPGLVCRTRLHGRTVTVRRPSWASTAVPLLFVLAAIAGTVAAVVVAVRRRRFAWGVVTLLAQPLVPVAALTAVVLPVAAQG